MLNQFKADFARLLDTQSPLFRQFFTTIRDRVEQVARNAHARALEENLVPGVRLQRLQALHWRMQAAQGLILPDCLAIASKGEGAFQSLVYVPDDDVAIVFVPLGPDRVLVGLRDGGSVPSVSTVNEALAACAWDAFVATDQTAELEALVPVIGTLGLK